MLSRRLLPCFAITLMALSGCSSVDTEGFLHQAHRGNYALAPSDLDRMQFSISREILAHRLNDDGTTSPQDVFVVPSETLGRVTEVGDTWLRVAFSPEGGGVVFLAKERGQETYYKLATEIEGRPGWVRVEDLPEPVLKVGDERFRIIHGANAFLLIDKEDLKKIVAERTHLQGSEKARK